jgi:hypothetical protein
VTPNFTGRIVIDRLIVGAGEKSQYTGIACCCARAATGHAAAPPSSVMN